MCLFAGMVTVFTEFRIAPYSSMYVYVSFESKAQRYSCVLAGVISSCVWTKANSQCLLWGVVSQHLLVRVISHHLLSEVISLHVFNRSYLPLSISDSISIWTGVVSHCMWSIKFFPRRLSGCYLPLCSTGIYILLDSGRQGMVYGCRQSVSDSHSPSSLLYYLNSCSKLGASGFNFSYSHSFDAVDDWLLFCTLF